MPDTLKKLREPAALAAVGFAGLSLLVAVIYLLAPPSGGGAVSFADRAYDQAPRFLDVVVAAAAAYAVYLANHVAPALDKARLITMVALGEAGVAALFGVVTALAQFGAGGVSGEDKFLHFLAAVGGGAVVAVAALFVWGTWQSLAPAVPRAAGKPAGRFAGGNWSGGQRGQGGASGQQYPPPSAPPGGFGWSPQQPAAPGQPGQPGYGGQPGQSGPTTFGQQPDQSAQGHSGYGGQPGQSGYGQPGAPTPPQPFGADRTQLLPPVQPGQSAPSSQSGYGQPPTPPVPPVPPTMQNYAPQPSTWTPGGPGTGGQPEVPQQGQPGQQQSSQQQFEDEQRSGNPFPIGEWRSE